MRFSTCEHCDQAFHYVNKGKPRRFCSHACYAAWMEGQNKGGAVTLICENCGQPFTIKRFYLKRSDGKTPQRFCSRACATPAINAAHRKFEERACLICGKPIYPKLNRGKLTEFCSQKCFGESGRAPKAWIAMQEAKQPSSIEARMRNALDHREVSHEFQYPIYSSLGLKRYVCDFAIPHAMLIVECDGDYWHAQPKAIASDKRKDKYLKERGYTVLRFSETEINQDVDKCVQVILSYL